MITQRYLIIKGKKSWISNIKLKFYVPFIFLVPILLLSASFFAIEIKLEENGDLYSWTTSECGNSLFFKIYAMIMILTESLLLVITLTVMNIATARAFIEYSKKKAVLTNDNNRMKDNQKIRFTRTMIILTVLYIITALCDNSFALFSRAIAFLRINVNEDMIAIINCIRQLAFLLRFTIHSLDMFIYVTMDKNLKRKIKAIFK